MRYFLQTPIGNESEITNQVLRGVDSIVEIAFDLESAAVPSDLNLELNNVSGTFDPARGLFAEGELTQFLVIVTSERRENVLFIGTVTDLILTETATAEVQTRSVIASLMNCSFNMSTVGSWGSMVEASPARLVADLLGSGGLQLPGIFLDAVQYDLADSSEQNLGLKMRLEIPAGDEMLFTDFLQELNRVTAAYVYSYNGFLRYARLGGFERGGYDVTFSGEVIAGTVKAARPVLWQKTKVSALYWDGVANQKITKTMPDYFGPTGDTIMERFREKPIESDGLGGKLVHATLASANVGLQDVLGWRGVPRWHFDFEVDAVGSDVRSKAQSVPLLSRARLLWAGGCTMVAIVEKSTSDQKAVFKGYSLVDPTFVHPARRVFMRVRQIGFSIEWYNNTGNTVKLYYRLESSATFSSVTLADEAIFTAPDPALEPMVWYQAEGMPCGELPTREMVFTPAPVSGFILGTSALGDPLG